MWRRVTVGLVVVAGCAGEDGEQEALDYDVSETRPMHVRAGPPEVGRAVGFDRWERILPDFPDDMDWPADPLSAATRDYEQARRDYGQANPAERTPELHAMHRTRDGVLRADSLAADMTVENGASPWQAAIALHRLTERALDRRQLEDPETVQRAAVALLASAPDHAATAHARFVLANLAASPSLSTYDPEQALAWALDALEHDASVAATVARLLEVLPGDLPLPDWAYDLMRPQWQAEEQAIPYGATFDYAVRRGHVEDALRERELVVGGYLAFCNIPDAEFACEPFLHWDEESTARMLRLGWTTSDDWRAHAHAAVAGCAVGLDLPLQATLSWEGAWALEGAPGDLAPCVTAELSTASVTPSSWLSIVVDVTR